MLDAFACFNKRAKLEIVLITEQKQ